MREVRTRSRQERVLAKDHVLSWEFWLPCGDAMSAVPADGAGLGFQGLLACLEGLPRSAPPVAAWREASSSRSGISLVACFVMQAGLPDR